MSRVPQSGVVSSLRAAEESGEVAVEIETGQGAETKRQPFRLGRSSVQLLVEALPLVRDGRVEQIEASDLDEDGWAI